MRTPSEKTQLRNALRRINELKLSESKALIECMRLKRMLSSSEEELKEWKARFDKLLEFRRDNGGAA